MPYADVEYRRAYDRVRKQKEYDSLTGIEFSELLLRKRREKALRRIRERNNKED